MARLIRFLDLGDVLRRKVRVKRRRRGCSDEQNLLALILSFCGGGHLSDVDDLGADSVACRLAGLRECARLVSRRLVPQVARHSLETPGYVPVFVDGSGIEVSGRHCDGTARGYNGERRYWLHSVFVGAAWVSARLNRGGTDVKGAWREQLETDVAPLLAAARRVWLRADSAYYCRALADRCRERGWEYSLSVTDPRQKAPVLRIVARMALAEREWTALDAEGREQAVLVYYRPSRWAAEEAYVVVRQLHAGEQGLLEPRYTVLLVSRDDLPLAELVRGHRSKQGQEHAQKGPLTDLGLHHPPCKSYAANQAFYLCGQIAPWLLWLLPYQLLPGEARRHGLRPLIRHFVRTVGRVVRSGRRQRLLLGRGNRRPDWLLHAAGRLEPA